MAPGLLREKGEEELMNRWLLIACVVLGTASLVACTGEGVDPTGGSDSGDGAFALTNTTHYSPDGLLRGQGLKLYTELRSADLSGDSVYDVEVSNDDTQEVLSISQVYVSMAQQIQPYSLLFDVGLYAEVAEGDNIRVELSDESGLTLSEIISLSALRLPGWDVSEVEAPEVFVCDQTGAPANGIAVGEENGVGNDYPEEVYGEVHVTGRGFPTALRGAEVDVYIVEARDDWMNGLIPQSGEEGHIYGPVAMLINANGSLPVTSTGFDPGLADVGPYDVLFDTDRNGQMDWSLGVKDSGDGTGEQVGFTVQLSQHYFDYLEALGERHILVNIAYNSNARSGGEWSNVFRSGSEVYSYLNPPVMHRYHFAVTKWIVQHQNFSDFWNNPALETTDEDGNRCIPFGEHSTLAMGIPVQRGCTNSGPIHWGPAMAMTDLSGEDNDTFDVVFDRNGDGCYAPGVDLLDVIGGGNTTGELVSFNEFNELSPDDQVGFRVVE